MLLNEGQQKRKTRQQCRSSRGHEAKGISGPRLNIPRGFAYTKTQDRTVMDVMLPTRRVNVHYE